jgi:hypothetical protein
MLSMERHSGVARLVTPEAREPENKYEPKAVVFSINGVTIGSVNRLRTEAFHHWLSTRHTDAKVERINGKVGRPRYSCLFGGGMRLPKLKSSEWPADAGIAVSNLDRAQHGFSRNEARPWHLGADAGPQRSGHGRRATAMAALDAAKICLKADKIRP